jgi:hypothetical protein
VSEKTKVWDLDMEAVGNALVTVAITSRSLGHSSVHVTARDYLAPHQIPRSPERQFVLDLLTRPVNDVVSEEEMLTVVTSAELPPLQEGAR